MIDTFLNGGWRISPVERRRRAEVEQTKEGDDEAAYGMRLDRYVEDGMHVTKKLSKRQTPVAGEAPAEPRLPGM